MCACLRLCDCDHVNAYGWLSASHPEIIREPLTCNRSLWSKAEAEKKGKPGVKEGKGFLSEKKEKPVYLAELELLEDTKPAEEFWSVCNLIQWSMPLLFILPSWHLIHSHKPQMQNNVATRTSQEKWHLSWKDEFKIHTRPLCFHQGYCG